MWKRSRNGNRKLDRALRRPLDRRCDRSAGKMSPGARRPNYLALACRALNQYLRLRRRLAKEQPHIFGPHSTQYFLDTLAEERRRREAQAALDKIYGPAPPGQPDHVSTLWTDRYHPPPTPQGRRIFFKWFHEKYPPPRKTT